MAVLAFISLIVAEGVLAILSVSIIVKAVEPRGYPIAYQSHDIELIDPSMPTNNLQLHLTMAAFVIGAQSNITAFAKLQPVGEDRALYSEQNRTIPEQYFLWFDGSYCPTRPVDVYSSIPQCKLELDRYPQDDADWSNVYWQGTYSDFPDEFRYSTIGIRYATAGVYGVALTDSPDRVNPSLSEPFITISDPSVTHTFFLGIEANQLSLTNLGLSFLILLLTIVPIQLKLFSFLRRKGVFGKHDNAT
ncbi:hypothetical protein NVIE_024930 [Nitrososphaera viennensis EN76]|uniref:Uncharacterized protein n=1 Tax=Nitrososphaera viennensis EN76 TaxID=926571 RepID=A0A060HNN1_9ARCH|nr:hypothetical protein NVIE_024930 [Nitrososphaera viennensis EN76]